MNNNTAKKDLHPFQRFLIELLSVRAGFYIQQKPVKRGKYRV